MTSQAQVLFFVARFRLDQQVLVVRGMRIVAFDAIADRRRMDRALQLGGVHVRVAAQAQRLGRGGRQLNPCDVFVNSDLMTAGAARRDRTMDNLPFSLFFVAVDTLCRISTGLERDRMDRRKYQAGAHHRCKNYE